MSKGFKKALSLLLVFALVVTSVYIGDTKKASADLVIKTWVGTLQDGKTDGDFDATVSGSDITIAATVFEGMNDPAIKVEGGAFNFSVGSDYEGWHSDGAVVISSQTVKNDKEFKTAGAKITSQAAKDATLTISVWDNADPSLAYTLNVDTETTLRLLPGQTKTIEIEYDGQVTSNWISGEWAYRSFSSAPWTEAITDVEVNVSGKNLVVTVKEDASPQTGKIGFNFQVNQLNKEWIDIPFEIIEAGGEGTISASAEDQELTVGDTETVEVTYSVVSGGALVVAGEDVELDPSFESDDEEVVTVSDTPEGNALVTAEGVGSAVVTIKNDGVEVGEFNVTVKKAEDPDEPKTVYASMIYTAPGWYPNVVDNPDSGATGINEITGMPEMVNGANGENRVKVLDPTKTGAVTYTVEVSDLQGNSDGTAQEDIFQAWVDLGNTKALNDNDAEYNIVITSAKLLVDGKEVTTAATLDDIIGNADNGDLRITFRNQYGNAGSLQDNLIKADGTALEVPTTEGGKVAIQFTIDFHYKGALVNPPVVNNKVPTTSVTAPKSVTLAKGEKATVAVAAAPANNTDTMTVKSSDTKVVTATLSGKKVTLKGVKAGKSANVTVTSGAKSATIKVKVTKAPQKVKANKKSVTVKKGKKATVKVTLYSAKKTTKKNKTSVYQLTAKVAKKKIATATVKGSKVTIKGKKKGSTKVTISTFNKKKVVVKVKVK